MVITYEIRINFNRYPLSLTMTTSGIFYMKLKHETHSTKLFQQNRCGIPPPSLTAQATTTPTIARAFYQDVGQTILLGRQCIHKI